MIVFCIAMPRVHLMNLIPMENPPEVLTAKARDIVKSLGYKDRPADWTSSFYAESGNVAFMQAKGHNMEEWARVFAQPPSAIGYWYRQAPTPLAAERFSANGEAGVGDPPVTAPGMLTVVMDLDGSLRRFAAVPPEREAPAAQSNAVPDWAPLFAAAHLDPAKFTPAVPEWSASVVTDARAAWTGLYRDRSDLPVRVEAASFHNRPVYFQVVWPWTRANRFTAAVPTGTQSLRSIAIYAIGAMVLIAALWVAHYNWKAGRADIRGATRVGIYCAGMSLIAWILSAHHVASDAEKGLIENALARAAYIFVESWLIYLASEPWVRRYWPQTMITWSRVLVGKWRDPLVGRDVLFGTLLGIVYALLIAIYEYANLRGAVPILGEFGLDHLNGFRAFASTIAHLLFGEVSGSLVFLLTLFLVRMLLKKQWLVACVWIVGWVAFRFMRANFLDSGVLKITTGVFWLLLFAILVFIMLRLGFFALLVAIFVLDSMIDTFLTTDFSAWYGQSSVAIVILIGTMAIWGFRLSLGSRPLFSPAALEKT
jgi:serine/threonine-protein kinase